MGLPYGADRIVCAIQFNVPRPREKPSFFSGHLRWASGRFDEPCCPMGLLPSAKHPTPFWPEHLQGFDQEEISVFGRWWDSLGPRDADEAMDLIWPR